MQKLPLLFTIYAVHFYQFSRAPLQRTLQTDCMVSADLSVAITYIMLNMTEI